MKLLDKTMDLLLPYSKHNRVARAFRAVFNPHGSLYEDQKIVLKALNTFCYITATHHGTDPVALARIAGRRETYNWIVGYMHSDTFEIEQLMREIKEEEDV